ncbi:MAG: hypothetical protein K1W24_08440 [Lachnospiraceae bacterium]
MISKDSQWCDKAIGELDIPKDMLIAMVIRDGGTVIPNGQTVLKENDKVVIVQAIKKYIGIKKQINK